VTSQTPAASLQSTFDAKPSAGQSGPEPSHDSVTSQTPADALHTPLVAKPSAGQSIEAWEQTSGTSQSPAEGRQITVLPMASLSAPQVPSVDPPAAIEQAMQSVVEPSPHVVSQQTPSTQLPDAQEKALGQGVPSVAENLKR